MVSIVSDIYISGAVYCNPMNMPHICIYGVTAVAVKKIPPTSSHGFYDADIIINECSISFMEGR